MAIEKKLINFSKLSNFETQLNAGNILDYSIVFIQDAKKIWTHGQYYDCNGGDGTSDSPTFLRIGDADNEAKANFMAVATGEKSADYYICSSGVQGVEVNSIVSDLVYDGPSAAHTAVSYSFYGSPTKGGLANKLLKITTKLIINTGAITTTYEAVLDAKQNTITDLENIREGALKGATSVQPNDIATVATSGSYEDLTNKPVYITDFDVLSLRDLALNSSVVDSIRFNIVELTNALVANKMVLVPYSIDDNSVRGYATLVGYTEDFLYFKVITDDYEINVETTFDTPEILGQEVTLRSWKDKQDQLISGTNIKTINGNSVLGSGDIEMPYYEDVGCTYVKKGISDDNLMYALPSSAGGKEDDILATKNTLKTINGESILGSGDISTPNIYIWDFEVSLSGGSLSIPEEKMQNIINADFIYMPQIGAFGSAVLNSMGDCSIIVSAFQDHLVQFVSTMTYANGIWQGVYSVDNTYFATEEYVDGLISREVIEMETPVIYGIGPGVYSVPQGSNIGVEYCEIAPGQELAIMFNTNGMSSAPSLIVPENTIWVHGTTPTLDVDTTYELSIRSYWDGGSSYVLLLAVLSSFKNA